MMIYGMVQALNSLHPDAQWAFEVEEYDSLQWFSKDIEKPTEQQIADEIERLTQEALQAEQDAIAAEEAIQAARESAKRKLAALGLTEDEVLALIG